MSHYSCMDWHFITKETDRMDKNAFYYVYDTYLAILICSFTYILCCIVYTYLHFLIGKKNSIHFEDGEWDEIWNLNVCRSSIIITIYSFKFSASEPCVSYTTNLKKVDFFFWSDHTQLQMSKEISKKNKISYPNTFRPHLQLRNWALIIFS